MSDIIAIKIDRKKLVEELIFKAQSGAEYIDAVLMPSKDSKYGDSHFIVQSVSKADREAGKRGPIIGNAKILGGGGARSRPAPTPAPRRTENKPKPARDEGVDEDVPF